MRRIAAIASVSAALAAFALPAFATTEPGQHTVITVTLTDRKTVVYPRTSEPRGVIVTFSIVNAGTKLHDWVFMGHRIRKLRPRQTAVLVVTLSYRGKYVWRSTTNTGAAFRGTFTVY